MLETYNVLLIDVIRNLKKNIKNSQFLYFLFIIMILFSILMIAMLTLYFIENDISVNLNDVFFVIFFMFLIKSSVDFYRYYISSKSFVYILSLPYSNLKLLLEIFLLIFCIQLGLWIFFSSIYNILIYYLGISLAFPELYLKFLFGVILSIILGIIIPIYIFNKRKYGIIPVLILLIILWFSNDLISLIIITFFSFVYLIISLNYAFNSYQYVHRKKRKQVSYYNWRSGFKKAIFLKETIVLWRDKLLFSILLTSVFIGFFSGYFAVFGDSDFLPESLKVIVTLFSKEIYAFFGIYIMTIYASVFISLNMFLNEQDTIWIIRNMPVSEKTIIYGKSLSLLLPFLCSIPFIAFFSAFTQGESLLFLIWFFIFSYFAGLIISFPLGAKFLGKKSDIMLLYSVSMLILFILGFSYSLTIFFDIFLINNILLYGFIITVELFLLYISLEFSAKILSKKY